MLGVAFAITRLGSGETAGRICAIERMNPRELCHE
jgi:hypothetical protein